MRNDELLLELTQLIKNYSDFKNKYQIDPFRNQKFREFLMADSLKSVDSSIKLFSDKVDFVSDSILNGEMKSCKIDKLKNDLYSMTSSFEFDKQNDPIRRELTLKYDAFSFGLFDSFSEELVGTLFINDKESVDTILSILKQKQEAFLKKMEEFDKNGKQVSRDSIQISLKEILECKNITFIKNSSILDRDSFLRFFNTKKTKT